MVLRVFSFLLGFVVGVSTVHSADWPVPLDLPKVIQIGCHIVERPDAEKTVNFWYTYFVALYNDKEPWEKLYSIRPKKDGDKSFEDCEKWMQFIQKLRAEAYVQDVK